ncbi:putative glycoside hydrolase family 43 protein [Diaporthe ampelina]|uniref:Putative glycoside hydrolase family 43 protein n=1 Tax=Diaporthe ampelina TaxID=1214573 RepID=A0A0G2FT16_9PEZI|nr:putative glycoside hydrolase family 43 protein [Diaporthe ampelina]
MPPIRNPILPGFNADPSILRVGEGYYIATSTFEWFPGVQIHHSTDLANWDLVCRPLSRKSQLDMRGDPDSCGVWAPCLTHDGEKFWLVYTDVKRKDGSFKDAHNYIVHSENITGPWSDPVYANSSGFDPSLFHDPTSGKKWFVNMLWDHRRRGGLLDNSAFAGIVLQEFDPAQGKLVGPRKNIYPGTELALVEGPHLYWRDGWYYLLTAEGGTGYEHAVTLARAKDIWGPDEERYWAESKYTFVDELHKDFQWLRTPEPERIFKVGDGKLTLYGREAIGSWFEQALVARRQAHFSYDAETVVDFHPEDERQFAGLTAYYCRYNFFYLTVTADSDGERELLLLISDVSWPDGNLDKHPLLQPVKIPKEGKMKLSLTTRGQKLQFFYALDGGELKEIGPVLDASILSDECGGHQVHGSFTGAFVGVACSDLNGTAREATFEHFVYRPVKHESDRYEI